MTTSSVVMAFGVSVTVGILFGVYPALKAAKIDPIDDHETKNTTFFS